jgi:peptidoglycan/LPS O-acetylase OafA/YrhL
MRSSKLSTGIIRIVSLRAQGRDPSFRGASACMRKHTLSTAASRQHIGGGSAGTTEIPPQSDSDPSTPPTHFSGFNALRLYAALSVVVAHTSHNFGNIRTMPADIPLLNWLTLDSQTAVNLFLVLSGFLVTYWMFRERETAGRFDPRRFYVRRVLRIAPVYYLVAAAGLFLIPLAFGSAFEWPPLPLQSLVLVLLFFPNFVTGLGPLEHLWCIGLEEQFYLVWPWVFKPRIGVFLRIVLGIILVKIMILPAIAILNRDSITNLYLGLRFECFALGAVGAYLYFTKSPFLKILCSLPVGLSGLGLMAGMAIFDLPFTEPAILASSIVFIILIMNLCARPEIGRVLEIPILNSLGKTSYGIYLYHYPLLYILLQLLNRWGIPEGPGFTALLHTLTIAGTLLLAGISYRFFEQPFLGLKKRFSVLSTQA